MSRAVRIPDQNAGRGLEPRPRAVIVEAIEVETDTSRERREFLKACAGT